MVLTLDISACEVYTSNGITYKTCQFAADKPIEHWVYILKYAMAFGQIDNYICINSDKYANDIPGFYIVQCQQCQQNHRDFTASEIEYHNVIIYKCERECRPGFYQYKLDDIGKIMHWSF